MSTFTLSAAQRDSYHQDGYLVLPNFVSHEVCDQLIERAKQLINQADEQEIKTIFSATSQQHAKSKYFLDSGDKIHFFFEENAFDQDGNLQQDRLLSINKIGHALHDLDPLFNQFSRNEKNAVLVSELGMDNPLLLQSMYICKQPHIGGEVNCHQDGTYLHTKETPVMGLWFALEDATIENGCLWAIPGDHRKPLKSRMLRLHNDEIKMEIYDETPWDFTRMIPLEVPRGSVIVLHGLLPHMSQANRSTRSRHAYSLHLISKDAEYGPHNWLKRPTTNPLKGFNS